MNSKSLLAIERHAPEIEVLVDPDVEVFRRSAIAPGMGILYRYHPDADRRLAEGFPRFMQTDQGRLVVARSGHDIVGYAVIVRPDPQERWGSPGAPDLWELGFIEVARGWRRRAIGRKLLRACFADGAFDDRIVVATAYAWHWDLEGTGLSKAEYRKMLERYFGSEGFEPFRTDEPNIGEDSANRLLVRIGPRVKPEARARFQALLRLTKDKGADPRERLALAGKDLGELLADSLQLWSPIWWLAPWNEVWRARSSQISKSLEWWLARSQPSPPVETSGGRKTG